MGEEATIITRISSRRGRFLILLFAILLLGLIQAYRWRENALLAQLRPLGPAGAPASMFPSPRHPIAVTDSGEYWTERERERTGEAKEVLNSLGLKSGMTVADLGAGWGYYTVRLARLVQPAGTVLAEDIAPAYLLKLKRRVERESPGNVTLILGEPHDPRLPPNSTDLAFLAHMYHEVTQPYGLLFNLLPALRPGARVAVVENEQAEDGHATPHKLLVCEFESLGFREIQWRQIGKADGYLALFEPPAQPPKPDAIAPCPR